MTAMLKLSMLYLPKPRGKLNDHMVGSRIDLSEPAPEKILLIFQMPKKFSTMRFIDIIIVRFTLQLKKSHITDFKEHYKRKNLYLESL